MSFVNNQSFLFTWRYFLLSPQGILYKIHLQLRAKCIYFARKTQGIFGEMKLKYFRDPVIVDWHNIHFLLVSF